jgi:hypothetical protein
MLNATKIGLILHMKKQIQTSVRMYGFFKKEVTKESEFLLFIVRDFVYKLHTPRTWNYVLVELFRDHHARSTSGCWRLNYKLISKEAGS